MWLAYPACLRENGQYVFERLFELRNQLLAVEMLIGTDLTSENTMRPATTLMPLA